MKSRSSQVVKISVVECLSSILKNHVLHNYETRRFQVSFKYIVQAEATILHSYPPRSDILKF